MGKIIDRIAQIADGEETIPEPVPFQPSYSKNIEVVGSDNQEFLNRNIEAIATGRMVIDDEEYGRRLAKQK